MFEQALFKPDGTQILTFFSNGTATADVWNADSGKHICSLDKSGENSRDPMSIVSVAYSPNGKYIAGLASGVTPDFLKTIQLRIWDADTHESIRDIPVKANQNQEFFLPSEPFSPDSTRILAIGNSNGHGILSRDQLKIWNVNSGTILGHITKEFGLEDTENALYSPDGSLLVTYGQNSIQFWTAGEAQTVNKCRLLYTLPRIPGLFVQDASFCQLRTSPNLSGRDMKILETYAQTD